MHHTFILSLFIFLIQSLSFGNSNVNKNTPNSNPTRTTISIDTAAQIITLYKQGKNAELTSDYLTSQKCYLQTITLLGKTTTDTIFGLAHLGLSNIHFRMANNNLALEHGYEALSFLERFGDTIQYINALNAVSQVYLGMHNLAEANDKNDYALELAIQIGDSSQIAYLYDHKGTISHFKGDHNQAIHFYKLAITINTKLNDSFNLSISTTNLAEQYLILSNYDSAFVLLNNAENLASALDFKSLLISIHYLRAQAYSKNNLPQQALAEFSKSKALINKTGENRELPQLLNAMAMHFYRAGDYKKAFNYLNENKQVSDSIRLAEINYQIEEIRLNYEMDKKEQEINTLLLEKQKQDRELKINRNIINLQYGLIILVALGFIASMVFTVFFFYSRRKIKLANRTKDVLFSIIGHDLRGPIGNIKQIIDLLNTEPNEKSAVYLKMLEQPVNAANILLDDLLTWARQINNQVEFTPKRFLINTLVEQNFKLVEISAAGKKITLINKLPDLLEVYADNNHLSTIFRNLITNAIKFTEPNGSITVSYEAGSNFHSFLVTDTGIGISPENIKRILSIDDFFTTFGTNNEKGSGIGLAICKKFIQLNGGTLEIESQQGKGSTFTFTLPKTQS